MNISYLTRSLVIAMTLAAGTGAWAQVSFSINVGPPPPVYEAVPMQPPGYIWAPGYWAWNNDHHVWIRGRSIVERNGYRWEPDRWEQRGSTYYRQPGNWARDNDARPPPQRMKNPRHMPQGRGPRDDDQGNGRRN
jgi:hypothetical protein